MLNHVLTPTEGKATGGPQGRQALRDRVGCRSNTLKALCLFDTGPGKSEPTWRPAGGTRENQSYNPVILGTWGSLLN